MRLAFLALASAMSLSAAAPAQGGEASIGVYAHDVHDPLAVGRTERGPQIVVGLRTAPLDELAAIWKPRVHLLVGVNPRGGTDYVAAGLSWRFTFGPGDRFYFQPGVGAAVHDGTVGLADPFEPGITFTEQQKRLHDVETKLDLGSRVLFEPELTLGWKATDRLSLELSWIHISHGGLAGRQNPGLTDIGLRMVYRYGVDR